MSNEYMLVPYHLRETLSDILRQPDVYCIDIAEIIENAPLHTAHDGEAIYQIANTDGAYYWVDCSKSLYEENQRNEKRIVYTAPPRVVWFDGKSPPKENGLPVLCKVEFDEGYFFDVGEYDDDHWITPSLEKSTVFTNARVVSWTHLEPITAGQES